MGFAACGRLLVERLMFCAMIACGSAVVRKLHARGGADDQHQHAEDNGEIAKDLLHAAQRFLLQYKSSKDVSGIYRLS